METKTSEKKVIKQTTEKLLKLLQVEGSFDIIENEEGAEIILTTKDTGIVIGYHGETLEALSLILSLCISKKIGRFIRISMEVGDYKKDRTEFLKSLALETKDRVLRENREIMLPSLKSWERRIVHLFLQEDEEVLSESIGEGRERTLVIKPRE